MAAPQVTEADIKGLETKLEALRQTLAVGERAVLERLLALAAAGHKAVKDTGEVEGFLLTTGNQVNLSTLAPRLGRCGGSTCSQLQGEGRPAEMGR